MLRPYHAAAFLLKQPAHGNGQDSYGFFAALGVWAVSIGLVPYLHPEGKFLWIPADVWLFLATILGAGFAALLLRSFRFATLLPAAAGSAKKSEYRFYSLDSASGGTSELSLQQHSPDAANYILQAVQHGKS